MTAPIVSVTVVHDYVLDVLFEDGARRCVDMEPFLRANADHEAISPYLGPAQFRDVRVVDGDLAWGDDWDILLSAADIRAGEVAAQPVGDV